MTRPTFGDVVATRPRRSEMPRVGARRVGRAAAANELARLKKQVEIAKHQHTIDLENIAPVVQVAALDDEPIEDQFIRFDRKNPHVYREFKRRVFILWNAGFRKYGVRAIMDPMRWDAGIYFADGRPWAINNNLFTHYARKIMKEFPVLDGLFELRELRA